MKKKTVTKKAFRLITMPLLALMLVLSTLLPATLVKADTLPVITMEMVINNTGHVPDNGWSTETTIQKSALEFQFTLPIGNKWAYDASKLSLVKEAFGSFGAQISSVNPLPDNDRTLTVSTIANPSFTIEDNEIYEINFSPALIENWSGTVEPIDFTVYATPSLSLGGSIIGATLEDIQKGGKIIELNLVNATWKDGELSTITGYNKFLESFTAGNPIVTWDVVAKLKNSDPNKVLSYSDDLSTLYLKLPATTSMTTGEIKFKLDATTNFYTNIQIDNLPMDNDEIKTEKTFNIGAQPGLTISPGELKEKNLKASPNPPSPKLEFTLTNVEWSMATNEKKLLFIESLQAKDQKDQWDLVKKELRAADVSVSPNKKVVTISIPTISALDLTKDLTVSTKIPYQLLENAVTIPEQTFTIKAQPKVLLSGTAVPSITQTDFAKGGKVITLSLVNTTWKPDVASSTTNREKLLNAFDWKTETAKAEILARADVKRTNDRTVTIKLPAISTKFTSQITFDSTSVNNLSLLNSNTDFLSKPYDAINVTSAANQSVTVTGTATNKINDLDIVNGGKTVILTLKNDTWVTNVNDIKLKAGSTPLTYTLERKNDTTVELKLTPVSTFELSEDSNVSVEIPAAAVAVSNSDIKTDSAFTISAVTASLSGTGVSMDPIDVQKGGKTVILTLKNAEFKNSFTTDEVKAMFTPSSSIPWNFKNEDIKVAKNKLTIKLPAVSNYKSTSSQSFNLVVNSEHLKGYESLSPTVNKVVIDGTVTIGGIASASLSTISLTEAAIQSGNRSITLTLTNAVWDEAIGTNASKKSALMKGFAVTDQTKEWGLVTSAIASTGKFSVQGKQLTITLPAVRDYAIIRDQKVTVTVPKTVLTNYKYDIPASQSLLITTPSIQSEATFIEMLESGLADYIDQHGLANIRVQVPEKTIQTISTFVTELNGKKITTIEVITNDTARKVSATLLTANGETSKVANNNGTNKFTFVFDGLTDNSTLHIAALDSSDELLGEVFKKVEKGNKKYTEVPKNPLDGKYSLHLLLTDKSLLTNLLKYYTLNDLKIGTSL